MTAANPDAAPEFYGSPRSVDFGDPTLDLPMTVRVLNGQDRAVRYSAAAVRAVRTTDTDETPWFIVAGADDEAGHRWLSDDEVRDWPVCPAVVNAAAFRLAAGDQTGHGRQAHDRGDMDVDAFRGGKP